MTMMEEKGAVCLVSAHKCVSGWLGGWLAQALTQHFTKGVFTQQTPLKKQKIKEIDMQIYIYNIYI